MVKFAKLLKQLVCKNIFSFFKPLMRKDVLRRRFAHKEESKIGKCENHEEVLIPERRAKR